ncbi:MAG TPA: tetratricopeptide repeat protein [Candidatus Sulfotelmatobacter sp.]|nr:tetratricopeptide repeat protein [Candidatus Sulfotelmatobacter sp.]
MRSRLLVLLLVSSVGVWAQSSAPSNSAPSNAQTPDTASSATSKPAPPRTPNLTPPRSDRVNADELGDDPGKSSSKDSPIDLSPPSNDDKAHPQSSEILMDAGSAGSGDINEFHHWNPHKAAKDIEVGDFYFKRRNYRAAEDRYREALLYKPNDAVATFRLAVCLEKMDQPDEARKEYENYLNILPHGPEEKEARKAIQRLKGTAANAKSAP